MPPRGRLRFHSSQLHGVSGTRTPTSSEPASDRGSARTAHHTTSPRYTIGIFSTTSMKIASHAVELTPPSLRHGRYESSRGC